MLKENVEILVEICRVGAILPVYSNINDAGMDIYAAEDTTIRPGQTVVIPTGLKVVIPEGYEIQIRPRSGISLKTPLRLANSPGTIDAGYRDEVGVIMTNTSQANADNEAKIYDISTKGNMNGAYVIKKGDRIAQFVLQAVPRICFTVVDSVKNIGSDRCGGFGSTGLR